MRIIANVYEETDYSVFKRLPDNRDVTESRVGKLMASIRERYILNPIIVNEKFEVIDGQGRFEARKALGLPIHYIMVRGATSDDCKRMNKYNSIWSLSDYATSYSKSGLLAYTRLLNVCKSTKAPITRIMRLANKGAKKTYNENYFSGKLDFKDSDAVTVKYILKIADEIHEALLSTNRRNDAFFIAVKVMCETPGYNHEQMIKNCKICRANYMQASCLENQLKEFERIYNHRRKTGKLFFSDYMRNKGYSVRDYEKSFTPIDAVDISTLAYNEED